MKPPICEICQKRMSVDSTDKAKGGLVWFNDFQQLPQGMVGHPKGLGWFCGQHYEQAQLHNNHSKAEAIRQIKISLK